MDSLLTSEPRCLRLEAKCDLWAARAACERSREFLALQGLNNEELDSWELVLAEATKNAVAYATDAGKEHPIVIEILAGTETIEARVFDHTPGFEFPERPTLPPPESRGGRGLYLMRELTDTVAYLRGREGNCLTFSRRRGSVQPAVTGANVLEQMKESERTLELMTEELASAYESLATIFRFSRESQRSTNAEDFAGRWLGEILEITSADWFVLRLLDDAGQVLKVTALSPKGLKLGDLDLKRKGASSIEVQAATERKEVWFDAAQPLAADDPLAGVGRARTGLAYPILTKEGLLGTLVLAREQQEAPFTAGEHNIIQTFADYLGVQIQNARYVEDSLQARLLGREMDLAVQVQRSLLPAGLPSGDRMAVSAFCRNAREVGGDFYDVLDLGEDGWLLVVADVMGKGLRAAMVATMFRTLVHSRRELAKTPGDFLTWMNENWAMELSRLGMFVTAQLVYVDLRNAELQVAGAGHPPLLIGGVEGGVQEVLSSGPPLGLIRRQDYRHSAVPFPPGARALTYTDGLIELPTPDGALLGLEPLKAWMEACAKRGDSAGQGKEQLLHYLQHHTSAGQTIDDQAFILLAHTR